MDHPGPAIAARDIVRDYGERRALDGFTLDVPAGAVFGVLGPNGSGKSTFIAMVAAMERPGVGKLRVLGQAPTRTLRARVGTVFQENSADPLMGTAEYLRFAGRLFGVSKAALGERVPALLERFGLAQRSGDPVSTLSGACGGDWSRTRLAARAVICCWTSRRREWNPRRRILWNVGGAGCDDVLCDNDLAEADAVCDRVAFVQGGR